MVPGISVKLAKMEGERSKMFLWVLLVLINSVGQVASVTIFAHMVNTPKSVRWALSQGATGIEIDVRFEKDRIAYIQHSKGALDPCDCSCICANGKNCGTESVCRQLWDETGSHCRSRSSAEEMTIALGQDDVRTKLSVIYIDSKLSNSIIDFFGAGESVVQMLNRNVFDRGYAGQVIISGSEVEYIDYLKGALREASKSKYASQYFYTFDAEGKDYNKVWNGLLELRTNNIVYSTGITICLGTSYIDAIKSSVNKNGYAGIGVWTLDKESSMKEYFEAGATAIMTNKPALAVEVAKSMSRSMDTPGDALVAKELTITPIKNWECDCNYHKGGCTISRISPPKTACKCKYKGAWTCGGETVSCSDTKSQFCQYPDASKQSCHLGGGDCEGYREGDTCDCNYGKGGCKISIPSSPGWKCKCKYKGAWTCGGNSIQCGSDEDCPAGCYSKECCQRGGGDCGAYR